MRTGSFAGAGPRPIDGLIAALTEAAATPLDARPGAIAGSLAPLLTREDLLDGCDCTPREDRYARRLIHADPAGRFAVLSLVWAPGQASPIHAHRAWCAFGVHRGRLSESHFEPPVAAGLPTLCGQLVRDPGSCAHAPASPRLIHRIANTSDRLAVSIHIYGVGLDAVETGVNHIYA